MNACEKAFIEATEQAMEKMKQNIIRSFYEAMETYPSGQRMLTVNQSPPGFVCSTHTVSTKDCPLCNPCCGAV